MERYLHSNGVDFEEKVKDMLLYRKVVMAKKIDEQTAEIVLDNGVVLVAEGNKGCYGCERGWYYLKDLNQCDNAITNVECDDDGEKYNIFIYAENMRIKLIEYDGYDNGYYGTGYSLSVSILDEKCV